MTAKTKIYIACEKCGIEVEKGCSKRRMCSTRVMGSDTGSIALHGGLKTQG